MANDFYNELNANPMWQQGLAMMRGENPSVALDRASAAQTMMAQEQERQRREQTRKALGQALSGGLTPEKINDIMAIDPEMGLKLLEHMRLQQQQDRLLREQQMMESLVSGGAGEMGDASAYILSGSDNPIMRGIGEKRIADIKEQRDIEKEARKPATEAQANAANFATRMALAEQLLTPLEQQGVSTANVGEKAAAGLPLIGNFLTSDEFKQYNQAAEDWVRAKLRKESGAVIGEEEMAREITTYFPQPGDTPAVIEQKRKARETALQGVSGGAKPGFKLPEVTPDLSTMSDEQLMQMLKELSD